MIGTQIYGHNPFIMNGFQSPNRYLIPTPILDSTGRVRKREDNQGVEPVHRLVNIHVTFPRFALELLKVRGERLLQYHFRPMVVQKKTVSTEFD